MGDRAKAVVIHGLRDLLGTSLITALNARDYPLVTGIVMTYTLAFVAINLIIDGLYAVVDPRIRY